MNAARGRPARRRWVLLTINYSITHVMHLLCVRPEAYLHMHESLRRYFDFRFQLARLRCRQLFVYISIANILKY